MFVVLQQLAEDILSRDSTLGLAFLLALPKVTLHCWSESEVNKKNCIMYFFPFLFTVMQVYKS